MAYRHGIYISENATQLQTMNEVDFVTVAVGTAPVHLAKNPAKTNEPVMARRMAEYVEKLGETSDSATYTLNEVAKSQFELYGLTPTVFINVFDPEKHFEEVVEEIEGETSFKLSSDYGIATDTIVVTTGAIQDAPTLKVGTDYEVFEDEIFGDEEGESSEVVIFRLKKEGGTVNISYRTASTALGGSAIETEVTLNRMEQLYLPSDTVLESVVVTTEEPVDTTREVPFKVETAEKVAVVTILLGAELEDNKCKVSYRKYAPDKVTAADIVGGVDAQGNYTGLALIDSIYPKYNLVVGNIIAPKFSLESEVVMAMVRKATAVSEVFPALAIVDIDTDKYLTYADAIEFKNNSNYHDCHLIVCYPKVKLGTDQYYLSTQIAGLMNRVDAANNNLPYVSPSNQALEISAAVLANGTEVYYNRDAANLLNAAGIVTVFAFNGLKAWGNYTAAYPSSSDPREIFIPVRKMFNFITAMLTTNYISTLDQPINRRMIEGLLHSANLYLNGLVTQGALLGGRLEFNEEDNTQTNLMNGVLNFRLYMTPPSPAQALIFTLEVDTDYYSSLFSS